MQKQLNLAAFVSDPINSNYELDITKDEFENIQTGSGSEIETIETPRGDVNIITKDGEKEVTTRDFSNSTDGASGEIFNKDGDTTAKIRFKEKDIEQ